VAGSTWAYEISKYLPGDKIEKGFAAARVVKSSPSSFEVQTPSETIVYEIHPDGIYKPKAGYYLIKDPLQVGLRWPLPDGGEVRINRVGIRETTDAGTFEGCITIVEEGRGGRAEWTYAPNVGPIHLRYFDLSLGQPVLIMEAKLKAFRLGTGEGDATPKT
jgi:hypothetical protein